MFLSLILIVWLKWKWLISGWCWMLECFCYERLIIGCNWYFWLLWGCMIFVIWIVFVICLLNWFGNVFLLWLWGFLFKMMWICCVMIWCFVWVFGSVVVMWYLMNDLLVNWYSFVCCGFWLGILKIFEWFRMDWENWFGGMYWVVVIGLCVMLWLILIVFWLKFMVGRWELCIMVIINVLCIICCWCFCVWVVIMIVFV